MIAITGNENVLGDGIGSIHLVDSMPQILACSFLPEDGDEEKIHCLRPSLMESGSSRWCTEHFPKSGGLVEVTAPGDQRIVDAARVSIAGGDVRPTSDDRKLIRYLVKNKHSTPLEQVKFTFHVRLPIFVARQWIRHRNGSFNEESARYGKLAGDFYIPSLERLKAGGQAKDNKQGSAPAAFGDDHAQQMRELIRMQFSSCYDQYERLLEAGLARELARIVLPTGVYTQWFWSTDLHNLMHFLRLRLHPHAQWETRRYAEAIVPMASALAPYAMEAFQESLEKGGYLVDA